MNTFSVATWEGRGRLCLLDYNWLRIFGGQLNIPTKVFMGLLFDVVSSSKVVELPTQMYKNVHYICTYRKKILIQANGHQ